MIDVTELNLTQLQELISNAQLELNKKIQAEKNAKHEKLEKSGEIEILKKEWESLLKEASIASKKVSFEVPVTICFTLTTEVPLGTDILEEIYWANVEKIDLFGQHITATITQKENMQYVINGEKFQMSKSQIKIIKQSIEDTFDDCGEFLGLIPSHIDEKFNQIFSKIKNLCKKIKSLDLCDDLS